MHQRGYVFVVSLAIAVVLSVFCGSLLIRSVSELGHSTRSSSQSAAIHLAEAAVDRAMNNLHYGTTANIASTPLSPGTYWAEVTQIGSLRHQVVAHGLSSGEQRNIEATIALTPESVFQYALFGNQQVNVSGNATTDSYDSRLGSYASQTPTHDGDVGTNSTSAGGVSVGGSIFVDGQVVVGPNVSNPSSLVTGYDPAFITGGTSPPTDTQDVVSVSATFPLPPVVVPPELSCNDFTVQGSTTQVLSPGTYCYRNLTIQGNGTLTATGEVTVYVTGQLTAQGNSVVGVVNDPTQMLFMMSATAEATLEQTISGNNAFYGAIYGPQATFEIQGNAIIYGSVIARQVNVSGSAEIHYDKAMTTIDEVSNLYKTSLVSWREL